MIQHWAHPTTGAYYATDISGIFSVNGLAPQGAFTKPQNSRYNVPRAPLVFLYIINKNYLIYDFLTKIFIK